MRYIPVDQIVEGMILGKTLYTQGWGKLLNEDTELKKEFIERIKGIGIQGIYIKDAFSEEIEIEDIVSPEVRQKTVQTLKSLFVEDSKLDEKTYASMQVQMKDLLDSIVDSVIGNRAIQVNMVDLKNFDEYTYSHSVNVAILAVATGYGLGLNKDNLEQLALAGALHDIGKKFVSTDILNKQGKLTTEEFELIKMHSSLGYRFLKDHFNSSARSYIGILDHHERFDGTGYPNQKIGEKISVFGKIISVVDVYDAITSKRPYHEPILPSEAYEYILAGSGIQFDPEVVQCFSRKVAAYPLGTEVHLSNGMSGIVVENYPEFNLRPKVKIYSDSKEPVYVNLKNDTTAFNITITGMNGFVSAGSQL